jgi:hypothetical protein
MARFLRARNFVNSHCRCVCEQTSNFYPLFSLLSSILFRRILCAAFCTKYSQDAITSNSGQSEAQSIFPKGGQRILASDIRLTLTSGPSEVGSAKQLTRLCFESCNFAQDPFPRYHIRLLNTSKSTDSP